MEDQLENSAQDHSSSLESQNNNLAFFAEAEEEEKKEVFRKIRSNGECDKVED